MSALDIQRFSTLADIQNRLSSEELRLYANLPDRSWTMFGAFVDGKLVGRCSVLECKAKMGDHSILLHYGSHLAVEPDYRSSGVALKLMAQVFAEYPDFVAFNLSRLAVPVYQFFRFYQVLSLPRAVCILRPKDFPALAQRLALPQLFPPLAFGAQWMLGRRLQGWSPKGDQCELALEAFFATLPKKLIFLPPLNMNLHARDSPKLSVYCKELALGPGGMRLLYNVSERALPQFGAKRCRVLKLCAWQAGAAARKELLRFLLWEATQKGCGLIELPSTGFDQKHLLSFGFFPYGAYELFLNPKHYLSIDKAFVMAEHYTPHAAMGDNLFF